MFVHLQGDGLALRNLCGWEINILATICQFSKLCTLWESLTATLFELCLHWTSYISWTCWSLLLLFTMVNQHQTTIWGKICLEPFPSIKQANPSICTLYIYISLCILQVGHYGTMGCNWDFPHTICLLLGISLRVAKPKIQEWIPGTKNGTPLKSKIATQNDSMFEAGDTFWKNPSFLVSSR